MLFAGRPVAAADVSVAVTDQEGRPVEDAVVSLWPAERGRALPSTGAQQHVIDQTNETFTPFVTVLRRGDTLIFTNSDRTRHHVYSFSPVKPFALALNPGEKSQAVKFDQSGIAAIGCNIHDKMIAYAFVTDTPWTAQTDGQGRAKITGVPKGQYRASLWHPRMDADRGAEDQTVVVGGEGSVAFSVPLTAPPAGARDHHRSY